MMKERLHDTATGPLRSTARGPCGTPSEPSPATPAPCQAPVLPAAAPGGPQGGAAGGSRSGAAAGPAEGGTELALPAASSAARSQGSPQHAGGGRGGGAPEPAAPQALAASATPTSVGPASAAVPGAAGAPVGESTRVAAHGTESAAAAGGQDSAAAQAGAAAGSVAGSLSGGAPEGGASLERAAVPGLGIGQGQGWGGNLRAAGGSPKASRTAALGDTAPPPRKFPRVRLPTVPPARERAPAAAAKAEEAGAQQVSRPGAQASQAGMPGNVVPPTHQHAAMGASEQGLLSQPGAQAAVEGMPGDAVLPRHHSVVEAAAEGVVSRMMLPGRQSASGAAAEVGAVAAGASRDDMPLQSRREVLLAGQPRAEPAAAIAVEAPVGQEEGPPWIGGSEAAQAAAVEQQSSAADPGGLQTASAGFEQPPAGRSGSAADVAARAAPGAGVVPGSGDPVGFSRGAGADGRAAPGSSCDAHSGWKRGQQGDRPAETGMAPRTQVHPAPQPPSNGLRRDLRARSSSAGRPSGNPGTPGVVGCAPPMGPAGAPGGAAVQQSIGGACGQRPGMEPGVAGVGNALGAGSTLGGRGRGILGAHGAPHVRGTAYMGTHCALGAGRAVAMGTQRAWSGRECAAPAGWHDPNGGCGPYLGPDVRAALPGSGRPRCDVRMHRAGSALCMAGGPSRAQTPATDSRSRARPHPRGGAPQCALPGRAHGSMPGPLDPSLTRRRPPEQHRPSSDPGDAMCNHAEDGPGGFATCQDPGGFATCQHPEAADAGAGRRGGALVMFAEANIRVSEQLPGPPPSQQLRQHSAPAGGRPRAHPGVQGRTQARPPAAHSRLGSAGAARTRTEHEGPYPGSGPAPHSSRTCLTSEAQLEQVLPAERGAPHWSQQEVGVPRAPCKGRGGAAPGAPVVPRLPLHSRSGSSQHALSRAPAMGPHPAGHAAATRRSDGACQGDARALEKPAVRAFPAERARLRAPPDAGIPAAAVAPARRARRGAPGADMATPPAQAPAAHGAKRVCSRAGGGGVPVAAADVVAAHQARPSTFRAGRAGLAAAAGQAPRAQDAKRACVKPQDAGRARVAVDATSVPRAKRACSRPEADGPSASPWQDSRRALGVGGAACGHGRELDQAGEPDEAPPDVSPTIARLVEQVLFWIWLAGEDGQLRLLHSLLFCVVCSHWCQCSILCWCRCFLKHKSAHHLDDCGVETCIRILIFLKCCIAAQVAAVAERKLRQRERDARKRRHEASAQGPEGLGVLSGLQPKPGCGSGSRAEGAARISGKPSGSSDHGADLSALVHAYVDGRAACGPKGAMRARRLPRAGAGAGPWVSGRSTKEGGPVLKHAAEAGSGGDGALGAEQGGCAGGQENANGRDLKALRVQAMRAVLAQLQQ